MSLCSSFIYKIESSLAERINGENDGKKINNPIPARISTGLGLIWLISVTVFFQSVLSLIR